MTTVAEFCTAILLTVFLLLVGMVLAGRCLTPTGRQGVYTILPAGGDGAELEQKIKSLHWLQSTGALRTRILLIDNGLTQTGLQRVALLERRYGVVLLPDIESLQKYFT